MQENPQAKQELIKLKPPPLSSPNLLHRYWLVWENDSEMSAEWLFGKDGSLSIYKDNQTQRGQWVYIPNLNIIRVEWEDKESAAWNLSVEVRSQAHRLILCPYGQDSGEEHRYELIDEQSLPRFYRRIAEEQGLKSLFRSLEQASQSQQEQEQRSLSHLVDNGRLWIGAVLIVGAIFGGYGLLVGLLFLLLELLISWVRLGAIIGEQRQGLHFMEKQRWDLPRIAELQAQFARDRIQMIYPNSVWKLLGWAGLLLWVFAELL